MAVIEVDFGKKVKVNVEKGKIETSAQDIADAIIVANMTKAYYHLLNHMHKFCKDECQLKTCSTCDIIKITKNDIRTLPKKEK